MEMTSQDIIAKNLLQDHTCDSCKCRNRVFDEGDKVVNLCGFHKSSNKDFFKKLPIENTCEKWEAGNKWRVTTKLLKTYS